MKEIVKFFLSALILASFLCEASNVSSSLVKKTETTIKNVKLFPNLAKDHWMKNLIVNNSSGKCSDDVKSFFKALSNLELWALKSNEVESFMKK